MISGCPYVEGVSDAEDKAIIVGAIFVGVRAVG
jgi:hypothetical protein